MGWISLWEISRRVSEEPILGKDKYHLNETGGLFMAELINEAIDPDSKTFVLDINSNKLGRVIGINGSTINKYRRSFKVNINAAKVGNGKATITIKGKPDGVSGAESEILSLIK